MAYITVGAKFTPFTYEERIKPLQEYLKTAEKTEQEYITELDELAQIGAKLPQGTKRSQEYQKLENRILASRDKLYNEGFTPELKRELNSLRLEAEKFKTATATQYNQYLKDQERRTRIEDTYGADNIKWNNDNLTLDSYEPILNGEGELESPKIDLGYTNLTAVRKQAADYARSKSQYQINESSWISDPNAPEYEIRTTTMGYTPEELDILGGTASPEFNTWVKENYGTDVDPVVKQAIYEGFITGNNYKVAPQSRRKSTYNSDGWANYVAAHGAQAAGDRIIAEERLKRLKSGNFSGIKDLNEDPSKINYSTDPIYGMIKGIGITHLDSKSFSAEDIKGFNTEIIEPHKLQDYTNVNLKNKAETALKNSLNSAINRVKEDLIARNPSIDSSNVNKVFNDLYDIVIYTGSDNSKAYFSIRPKKEETAKTNIPESTTTSEPSKVGRTGING